MRASYSAHCLIASSAIFWKSCDIVRSLLAAGSKNLHEIGAALRRCELFKASFFCDLLFSGCRFSCRSGSRFSRSSTSFSLCNAFDEFFRRYALRSSITDKLLSRSRIFRRDLSSLSHLSCSSLNESFRRNSKLFGLSSNFIDSSEDVVTCNRFTKSF